MTIEEQLGEKLAQAQNKNSKLQAWRFNLYNSESLDIGVKDNKLGGPYSAPGYKKSLSGELYLIWEGQRFTSAKLDAQTVDNFDQAFALWEKTAYFDPDGVGLYAPPSLPEVPLDDEKVQQVIRTDIKPAFQVLTAGLETLLDQGIRKVDARINCSYVQRVMCTSDGFKFKVNQTPVNFYFIANDSYGKGYAEKRWAEASEIRRVLETTINVNRQLDQTVAANFSGPLTLILPPEMFESFLSHFLITNLSGGLVVNRQSRFGLDDFKGQQQVLREDFGLKINNLRPYRSGSYSCTSEGVPGGEISLINAGKLQTPLLNLKYSRKTGLNPTPMPTGGGGFFFESSNKLPTWEELLPTIKQGLIIYSVLGMHTQDAASGNFSLTADQCLLVEEGQVRGKVKAVINGDFFAALNQADSQLYVEPGEENPGLVFVGQTYALNEG